jgi:hypothetical protein
MVARDRLLDTDDGGQTATPSSPTASESCAVAGRVRRLLLRTTVAEAIVIIPSPTHADLYALLQCGEDSEYGGKAYGSYIKCSGWRRNFQFTNA